MSPQVFKVKVKLPEGITVAINGVEVSEFVMAVDKNPVIKTIEHAVAHAKTLHHKDSLTGDVYPFEDVTPVQAEPFSVDMAPRVLSLHEAIKAQQETE